MPAAPLPSSPNPSGQADNSAYQKLSIHLTNVSNAQIQVVFTPILSENSTSNNLPSVSIQKLSTLLSPYAEATVLPVNEAGEYEIYNAEQLFLFAEMVNSGNSFSGKTIKLMNDIDLKNRTFAPIGGGSDSASDRGMVFSGTFDGCGHEIRNLLIYQPQKHFVALFGTTVNAAIRNVGVDRCKVYASTKVACLVALAINTTIDGCFTRGDAISAGKDAGGLSAQVSGNISITNSYHNGNVESTRYSGGILGYLSSKSTLTIENCYYVGTLVGAEGFTGMIGYYGTSGTYAATAVQIRNCYTTANMKGSNVVSGSIESYTDCLTVTKPSLVSCAIQLGDSFLYDCEWENDGYPVQQWQCDTSLPEDYVITTEAQLRLLAYMVNSGADSFDKKTVTLGNDIDLKLHEWTPIGGNSADDVPGKTFRGVFDGNGYVISNLSINSGRSFVGLLGYVRNATVRKVGIEKSNISAAKGAGLVGYAYTGSVIQECYSKAAVSGHSGIGGILGMVGGANCKIVDCYYTGTLTVAVSGAGVLGYISSDCKNISVQNSYCAGTVSHGIVGNVNAAATDCMVNNSYCVDSSTLTGSANALAVTESAALNADTLRTYADVLGSSYTSDCALNNDGFPIFTWQHARSAVIQEAVEPTCTETGLTEGKYCSVCNAVIDAQEVIPATGHSYAYENNGENHIAACAGCGDSRTEEHSYVDGVCICGAAEVTEPTVDTNITMNHTLNLESDISIIYVVKTSLLADYESCYLECVLPTYEGNNLVGATGVTVEPVLTGNYYYFTLTGVSAVKMNDIIEATLHMSKNGKEYVSKVDTYSIATYAYSQLNKDGATDKLKALCADLLRYGAAAQIYKGYRTNALVNAAMTEAHTAYLSDIEAVTFRNNNVILGDIENPSITWAGKVLNLGSKVELKFVINTKNYTGSLENLSLHVSYNDNTGTAQTAVITDMEDYDASLNWYSFSFDGLMAAELRQVVSVAVYEGSTQVSPTLQYSADTYGNNKAGTLLQLCKALFAYSDTALAYFTK